MSTKKATNAKKATASAFNKKVVVPANIVKMPAAKKAAVKAPAKKAVAKKAVKPLVKVHRDYAPFWSLLQTAIFDFVRSGAGAAIVEAVAGSGKTTTICEAIRYMTGSVIALAFNRSIAKELKDRLACFPNVTAGTVHATGKRALEAALPHRVKVDKDKLVWLFKDHLETKTNWQCKGNVVKLCTLAKDTGAGIAYPMDDRETWEKVAAHFTIPATQYAEATEETFDVIAMAMKLLALSNKDIRTFNGGKSQIRIDFSDMIYLPLLFNISMPKFDWVIVDEAQDLNVARQMFVKALSHEGTRHLIVGDTAQAIYGFTGADAQSMATMKREFNCTEFPLSVSFRCAASVVEYAQQWMPRVESHPSAVLGSVTSTDYAEAMADCEHVFKSSDAILCRTNAPLVKTAMQLIRANVPCKIEGNDLTAQLVDLAKSLKGKARNMIEFRQAVIEHGELEAEKAEARGNSSKAQNAADLAETLLVFVDRAIEVKLAFTEMLAMIQSFFSYKQEDGTEREVLTLSTIHKAKGREWSRVFWIDHKALQPSKFAKLEWELEQEKNLCYVAATRAKLELVNLESFKKD